MTRPRSLADELAELVNPAPQAELDPEAAGIADGDHLGGSDDELAAMVATVGPARRTIATDIALTGGQYSGRRSSRAALFGGDEQGGAGSSSDEDDAAPDDAGDAAADRRRHIDLATVPTMFVNGHMHGPGRDDTTSSSSTGDDEEGSSEEEGNGQLPSSRHGLDAEVHSEHADAAAGLGRPSIHQQPQQEGPQQAPAANGTGDSSSEGGEGESEEEEEEKQQQQQPQEPDDSSSDSDDEGQGEEEEEDGGADVADRRRGQHRMAAGAAAAAADVTALLGDDAEMQELEQEAAAAQAEAAEQLVASAARSGRDTAKAAGVRSQQRLWGAALEMRIRLQRCVSGCHVLPRAHVRTALVAGNTQLAHGYSALLSSCQATLEDMLQLHHTLAQQHPAAAASLAATAPAQQQQQAAEQGANKRNRAAAGLDTAEQQQADSSAEFAGTCRTAADAWAAVDGAISCLAGFRDASLDKWHRRTVLSSGTAALRGSSGLRALQQSVSSQVAALMADKQKLISRSQLPVQLAPRPLGQPAAGASGADGDADAAAAAGRERDPETYDEGDFYQQLLKELIDSAPAGGLHMQLAGARPPKRRKVVDRRASKGRKIRYHTMDKLVGFMAPSDLVQPPFAEQLFGNLFSHQG